MKKRMIEFSNTKNEFAGFFMGIFFDYLFLVPKATLKTPVASVSQESLLTKIERLNDSIQVKYLYHSNWAWTKQVHKSYRCNAATVTDHKARL